jgi:hypothetical protein
MAKKIGMSGEMTARPHARKTSVGSPHTALYAAVGGREVHGIARPMDTQAMGLWRRSLIPTRSYRLLSNRAGREPAGPTRTGANGYAGCLSTAVAGG